MLRNTKEIFSFRKYKNGRTDTARVGLAILGLSGSLLFGGSEAFASTAISNPQDLNRNLSASVPSDIQLTQDYSGTLIENEIGSDTLTLNKSVVIDGQGEDLTFRGINNIQANASLELKNTDINMITDASKHPKITANANVKLENATTRLSNKKPDLEITSGETTVVSSKDETKFRKITVSAGAKVNLDGNKIKADKVILANSGEVKSSSALIGEYQGGKVTLSKLNTSDVIVKKAEEFNVVDGSNIVLGDNSTVNNALNVETGSKLDIRNNTISAQVLKGEGTITMSPNATLVVNSLESPTKIIVKNTTKDWRLFKNKAFLEIKNVGTIKPHIIGENLPDGKAIIQDPNNPSRYILGDDNQVDKSPIKIAWDSIGYDPTLGKLSPTHFAYEKYSKATDLTKQALDSVLAESKKVYDSPTATNDDVLDMETLILDKYDELVEKTGNTFNPTLQNIVKEAQDDIVKPYASFEALGTKGLTDYYIPELNRLKDANGGVATDQIREQAKANSLAQANSNLFPVDRFDYTNTGTGEKVVVENYKKVFTPDVESSYDDMTGDSARTALRGLLYDTQLLGGYIANRADLNPTEKARIYEQLGTILNQGKMYSFNNSKAFFDRASGIIGTKDLSEFTSKFSGLDSNTTNNLIASHPNYVLPYITTKTSSDKSLEGVVFESLDDVLFIGLKEHYKKPEFDSARPKLAQFIENTKEIAKQHNLQKPTPLVAVDKLYVANEWDPKTDSRIKLFFAPMDIVATYNKQSNFNAQSSGENRIVAFEGSYLSNIPNRSDIVSLFTHEYTHSKEKSLFGEKRVGKGAEVYARGLFETNGLSAFEGDGKQKQSLFVLTNVNYDKIQEEIAKSLEKIMALELQELKENTSGYLKLTQNNGNAIIEKYTGGLSIESVVKNNVLGPSAVNLDIYETKKVVSGGYNYSDLMGANYSGASSSTGAPDDITFKRKAFEILAWFGYEEFIKYINNTYRTDDEWYSYLKNKFNLAEPTYADLKISKYKSIEAKGIEYENKLIGEDFLIGEPKNVKLYKIQATLKDNKSTEVKDTKETGNLKVKYYDENDKLIKEESPLVNIVVNNVKTTIEKIGDKIVSETSVKTSTNESYNLDNLNLKPLEITGVDGKIYTFNSVQKGNTQDVLKAGGNLVELKYTLKTTEVTDGPEVDSKTGSIKVKYQSNGIDIIPEETAVRPTAVEKTQKYITKSGNIEISKREVKKLTNATYDLTQFATPSIKIDNKEYILEQNTEKLTGKLESGEKVVVFSYRLVEKKNSDTALTQLAKEEGVILVKPENSKPTTNLELAAKKEQDISVSNIIGEQPPILEEKATIDYITSKPQDNLELTKPVQDIFISNLPGESAPLVEPKKELDFSKSGNGLVSESKPTIEISSKLGENLKKTKPNLTFESEKGASLTNSKEEITISTSKGNSLKTEKQELNILTSKGESLTSKKLEENIQISKEKSEDNSKSESYEMSNSENVDTTSKETSTIVSEPSTKHSEDSSSTSNTTVSSTRNLPETNTTVKTRGLIASLIALAISILTRRKMSDCNDK